MKFYRLTYPEYASDHADRINNPVNVLGNPWVPPIVCDQCGSRWSWSGCYKIRKKFDYTPKAKEILEKEYINVNEWTDNINILASELGVQQDLLRPGTKLGLPRGEFARVKLHDFIHPFPGIIWVKKEVADLLLQINPKGVEFCEVEVNFKKSKEKTDVIKPEIREIVVLGKAWRRGSSLKGILECEKCKLITFPNPKCLEVDETTWDGSDFFNVDFNPNITIVTERIYEFIMEHGFTNVLCKPI